jgi:outer membrane protein
MNKAFARQGSWLLLAGLVFLTPSESLGGDNSTSTVRELGKDRAVQMAMVANPTLRAAVLELRSTKEGVRLEEGRYPYILQLDGGVTRTATPAASDTGTSVSRSDSIDVGAQVSRTFPTGTQASLRLDGYRDMTRAPERSGPGYGTSVRAAVTQPLMRGAGIDVGEQQLRIARINRTASELSRDRVASEVARDVLIAYWELWYAERSAQIEMAARDLAKRQRDEARQRVEDGALAPVELLSFETRTASLEEGVASMNAERRTRSLTLSQRIGSQEGFSTAWVAVDEPVSSAMPLRTALITLAESNSPEIRELSAQLRLAKEQLAVSGESYRPRLDLEGYVQVAGAGYQEVPPAFEQLGTGRATSAHIGLVYELPLGDGRKDAERARDLLSVRMTQQRLLAVRQRIRSEIETLWEQERAARVRLQLADKTVSIAERQVTAETERFEIGVAISVQVHEAEDSLRQARLRAARARVDLVESEIQRDHSAGRLLMSIADQLHRSDS